MYTAVIQPKSNQTRLKEKCERNGAKYVGVESTRLFRQCERNDEFQQQDKEYQYQAEEVVSAEKSKTLCILAIPTLKVDFEQFLSGQILAGFNEHLESPITIIECSSMDKSMFSMVLKMKTQAAADKFFSAFNGRYFKEDQEIKKQNEIMHTVYLSQVISVKNCHTFNINLEYQRNEKNKKNTYFEELPTCPQCLEKIDSSASGLPICNLYNTFSGALDLDPSTINENDPESLNQIQWPFLDQQCRICRDQILFETKEQILKCSECENQENLWICLICGYIGCGRYFKKHAVNHFDATAHTFSVELNTQRMWNYRGDNYVHTIIKREEQKEMTQSSPRQAPPKFGSQNQIMTLPDQSEFIDSHQINSNAGGPSSEKYVNDRFIVDKIQNSIFEYNHLLTSQLEEQRSIFEKKLKLAEEDSKNKQDQLKQQLLESQDKLTEMQSKTQQLLKSKHETDQKNKEMQNKLKKSQQNLTEEIEVNKNLIYSQQKLMTNEPRQVKVIEKLKRQLETKKEILAKIQKENEELMNMFN